MIKVRLDHNPYIPYLSVSIDGQPLSPYSPLVRFQKLPFMDWCSNIVDILDHELNGAEYEIEYYGRKIEADILIAYAQNRTHGPRISRRDQTVPNSARERLAILSRLTNNGIVFTPSRIRPELILFCNSAEPAINRDIIPQTRFYKIATTVLPMSQKGMSVKNNELERIALFSNIDECHQAVEDSQSLPVKPFFVLIDERNVFIDIYKGCFIIHCSQSILHNVLQEVVEIRGAVGLLKTWLNTLQDSTATRSNDEVLMLTQTEAVVKLQVPSIVEVGEKSPITLSVIPCNAPPPSVVFRTSDSSIIGITTDMFICANSTGQVRVEAYLRDSGDRIGEYTISAIHRKKVQKISISTTCYTLTEGEKQQLEFSVEPSDADNLNKLCFESSDPLIAYVDNKRQEIVARNDGCCGITIRCEKAQCDFSVDVRPRIRSIEVSLEKTEMVVDEIQHYAFKQLPDRSISGHYQITVIPQDALFVDHASRMICAKKEGEASIVFQHGQISRSVTIHVSAKNTRSYTQDTTSVQKDRGFFQKLFGKWEG